MENLCGHYDKVLGCLVTFDGSCCKEECFTYRLLLLLQAKVQECEELKEENFTFEQLIKEYEKYGAIE